MNVHEKVQKFKAEASYNLAVMELATSFDKSPEFSPLIFFSPEQLNSIEQVNRNAFNKAVHILSLGSNFNVDEYIWFLTIRTNYQLIKRYYNFYNIDILLIDETQQFDSLFISTLGVKGNKRNAITAARVIEKNRIQISTFFWKDIFSKLGIT